MRKVHVYAEMKFTIQLDYSVGDKIRHDGGVWKVIGFEYVKGRGIRYILLTVKNQVLEWLYLFSFEIKALD